MSKPDSAAVRVLRRHRAATSPLSGSKIVLRNPGRISGDDVAVVLERHVGRVLAVQFHDSMSTGIGEVVWEAKAATGDLLTGTIRIHAAVSREEIVNWAELSFDAR